MSHKRTDIRRACIQSLKDQTDAQDRVLSNRAAFLFGITFPSLNVFTVDETGDPESVDGAPTIRKLTLAIDIYVAATSDLDEVLDDMSKQVEDVMADDDALGASALSSTLISTAMDFTSISETPIGVARLHYEIIYLA